jgi:hypothetical protein
MTAFYHATDIAIARPVAGLFVASLTSHSGCDQTEGATPVHEKKGRCGGRPWKCALMSASKDRLCAHS